MQFLCLLFPLQTCSLQPWRTVSRPSGAPSPTTSWTSVWARPSTPLSPPWQWTASQTLPTQSASASACYLTSTATPLWNSHAVTLVTTLAAVPPPSGSYAVLCHIQNDFPCHTLLLTKSPYVWSSTPLWWVCNLACLSLSKMYPRLTVRLRCKQCCWFVVWCCFPWSLQAGVCVCTTSEERFLPSVSATAPYLSRVPTVTSAMAGIPLPSARSHLVRMCVPTCHRMVVLWSYSLTVA